MTNRTQFFSPRGKEVPARFSFFLLLNLLDSGSEAEIPARTTCTSAGAAYYPGSPDNKCPRRRRRARPASPEQGLKFWRNFAEFRRKISFSLVTGEKNFGIFRKISFENSKFKKIRPKFTEIRRNLPKFRNEISFPLNTGICNENEMVNPGQERSSKL